MSEDERAYFRQRAEAEIEAAQAAGHPDAARAHYRLAGYYLDLAHNPVAASGRGTAAGEYDGATAAAVTAGAAFA